MAKTHGGNPPDISELARLGKNAIFEAGVLIYHPVVFRDDDVECRTTVGGNPVRIIRRR